LLVVVEALLEGHQDQTIEAHNLLLLLLLLPELPAVSIGPAPKESAQIRESPEMAESRRFVDWLRDCERQKDWDRTRVLLALQAHMILDLQADGTLVQIQGHSGEALSAGFVLIDGERQDRNNLPPSESASVCRTQAETGTPARYCRSRLASVTT
jgi:hypothetical protein